MGAIPVSAATIVVTSAADSGAGSLRQAIADSAVGGRIEFAPSLSGATIYLASTLIIDKGLAIDGSALPAKITISGDSDANGTGNVPVIDASSVNLIALDSLVITKGFSLNGSGGGVRNISGNLAIIRSVITANTGWNGGGLFNLAGTVTITKSTISGNTSVNGNSFGGGGILNFDPPSTLILRESTVSGNFATGSGAFGNWGGGIYNLGTLTITNSSIVANAANGWGGGIYNTATGIANVFNSTIAYNGANQDDDANGGQAGGVVNYGVFAIRNTLIAANNIEGIPLYDDCAGTINSYGRNLIRALDTTNVGTCTINSVTGSWTQLNAIALLSGLQNNGGPTLTVALLPGSSAIDGADPVQGCIDASGVIPADQRGVLRSQGVRCDVGAFEYAPATDTDGDGVANALDNCTLRANPEQCDSNGDGYGNRCDGDLNNNGVTNAQDTTLYRQQLGQPSAAPIYNVADLNCSGSVNAQDSVVYRGLLGSPPGASGLVP
jgi:hypothetical protein